MNNILVTGGAGYIGSHIIELLIKQKYKVFIIDNLSTGYRKLINKKAKFYKLNIFKTKQIKEIILKNNIDSIIHLAASASVTEGKKNYNIFYKNNVECTTNLIKACRDSLVKNFMGQKKKLSGLANKAGASGGGGGVSAGTAPQAPSFNVIGQTSAGDNMVAGAISSVNDAPMRAYVVESDVTSSQAAQRATDDAASIG